MFGVSTVLLQDLQKEVFAFFFGFCFFRLFFVWCLRYVTVSMYMSVSSVFVHMTSMYCLFVFDRTLDGEMAKIECWTKPEEDGK